MKRVTTNGLQVIVLCVFISVATPIFCANTQPVTPKKKSILNYFKPKSLQEKASTATQEAQSIQDQLVNHLKDNNIILSEEPSIQEVKNAAKEHISSGDPVTDVFRKNTQTLLQQYNNSINKALKANSALQNAKAQQTAKQSAKMPRPVGR